MAERCVSLTLPKLVVPGLGAITVGFNPPALSLPLNACCQLGNFGWTTGSLVAPISLPGPVADALAALELIVDDYNAAAEFQINCPGN